MVLPAAGSPGFAERGPFELAGRLRPAQAGAALAGSARAAHIAATLIDLDIRGHLAIEKAGDDEGLDWLLSRRVGMVRGWRLGRAGSGDRMLGYERALLSGLPRRGAVLLSGLGKSKRWVTALRKAYRQLDREAIRRGWMRPSRAAGEAGGDALGDGAESLASQVRSLRRRLSGFEPAGTDAGAWFREYLPYAVALGLTPQWAERFAALQPPAGVAGESYGYGLTGTVQGTAFADSACTHIHSVVTHGGHAGAGGHHGGTGHGGGGHHGGGHHGGAFF